SAAGSAVESNGAIPGDSLTRTIDSFQSALRIDPTDARRWAELGFAYVQQARVTADPTYYPKAEGVLRRSLELRPHGNFDAYAGTGSLAAARHDFAAALAWGERARALDPYSATVRAI